MKALSGNLKKQKWTTRKPTTGHPEVDECWLDIVDEAYPNGASITTAYKQDAHLIASAPDMKELIDYIVNGHSTDAQVLLDWALRLQAKAEGHA